MRTDGSVACWGDDGQGQASPPPGPFEALAASGARSCGLRGDGTVECWGAEASPIPEEPVQAISGSCDSICGTLDDFRVRCWGTFVR